MIFDARPANAVLEPRHDSLRLFTLPAGVSGTQVSLEIVGHRHFYYQFSLRHHLAEYFTIQYGARRYLPKVLPMDFHEACSIAQATSLP